MESVRVGNNTTTKSVGEREAMTSTGNSTEIVHIVHVGGEGPTDVSEVNNKPSGFPQHLVPSEWKRIRFVFHDFATLPHEIEDGIMSDVVECHGQNWSLELYPGGDEESAGYVSAYLQCDEVAPGQEVHARYCFHFGQEHFFCTSVGDDVVVYEDTNQWGEGKLVRRTDVLRRHGEQHWKNLLDDSGNFTVDVDIQVGIPRSYKPENSIKADMVQVFDKACEENSDVVFQVGDRTFHCLSGILQVRAPELYSLVSEYDERTPIPILEVSPDTFQLLMLTVYGGDIPADKKSLEILKSLIIAADRFGCTNPKVLAEQELVSSNNIRLDNVAELLLFADGANCALLKEAATSYILAKLKDVRKTDGYAKLKESPDVLEELLIAAAEANEKRPASPNPDERDPKRLCVAALRSELNNKGLDVDGSREMLVSRLEEANAAAAAAAAAAAEGNADDDRAIEVE